MGAGWIDPAGKLTGHLDRLADLQAGRPTPAPINVEIDLSNRCSLGCEWCHFAYTHTRGPLAGSAKPAGAVPGGDLMDTALAYSVLSQLAEQGVRSITWTGGGEPTLHPAFDELVRHAAAERLPQGLYTHGGHIDKHRARLLKQASSWVYVSLDAADAAAYHAAKRVDRFDRACDAIRLLAAADGPATVGVGYLVTEQNLAQAGRAAELARELGADYIQFRPTIRYQQTAPGIPAEGRGWVAEAIRDVLRPLATDQPGFVVVDLERFGSYAQWAGHGYDRCHWSALQTVITPNGKVWACVNKREHPEAEIGDLTVEPFRRVWWRHRAVSVDGDCRVLCRGHVANTAVEEMLRSRPHAEFV